jgi:hypothetical protein
MTENDIAARVSTYIPNLPIGKGTHPDALRASSQGETVETAIEFHWDVIYPEDQEQLSQQIRNIAQAFAACLISMQQRPSRTKLVRAYVAVHESASTASLHVVKKA